MPHISVKMLKGRTDEQKRQAAQKLENALCEAIGCTPTHISIAIEDYTAEEWQEVFQKEIAENDCIFKKPEYDPKDLL